MADPQGPKLTNPAALTPARMPVGRRKLEGGSQHTRPHGVNGRPGLLMTAAVAVALLGMGSWFLLEDAQTQRMAAPRGEFIGVGGESFSLAALRGQVVLVSFWDADSALSQRQITDIAVLHRQLHGQGLRAIAVAGPGHPQDKLREFARQHGFNEPGMVDGRGDLARHLGPIATLPTHVIIDRQGFVVQRLEGDIPMARLSGRISETLADQ